MSFVKAIYSKRNLSVLDVGADRVAVLVGEKRPEGTFRVQGAGIAESQGIENGEIVHLGDAVESAAEAIQKAEKSSGIKIRTLYFNYDDPKIESVRSRGSKLLQGEGEIQASDIEEACETAERLASSFEKKIIYSKPIGFIIDERDPVLNPVGVFGRKLDVLVHLIQADSQSCELWHRLVERAGIRKGRLVFSAWSTAYGIIPKPDRAKKRLVVDLGGDFSNFFIFANDRVVEYEFFLTKLLNRGQLAQKIVSTMKGFLDRHKDSEQVLVTGDLSEGREMMDRLKAESPVPLHTASPLGVDKLQSPGFSSLVGLL